MRKSLNFIPILVSVLLLLSACSGVPDGVISKKKMENILYDSYIGMGLSETELQAQNGTSNARKEYLYSVLDKYDVSKAEYDSSLNWYMQNLKVYMKIYDRVIARLIKEQKRLQLEQGDQMQNDIVAKGDSVNIWMKENRVLLNDLPAFSHYFSEIRTDDGFEKGDKYQFDADVRSFTVTTGQLPKMVLTVIYKNDSVQTITRKIEGARHMHLDLQTSEIIDADKIIAGFTQNSKGLIMIDKIELKRIHNKPKPDITVKSDSTVLMKQ